MIKVQNLCLAFGKNQVISNVSQNFTENSIHGIVGLNGSGKSTFFNLIAKIVVANSGIILLNDSPINKKDIAFLETSNFFYSRITGKEYLNIFTQSNGSFNLKSLQNFMKLPLDDLIETYSTGMKKKLALLAILKQEKLIYLFDEPFNGLDMETNKVVEQIILTLKEKGKTIFLSSHIIDPLLSICDEIHYIEEGRFKRSYNKKQFNEIENDLFQKLKYEIQTIIESSI
jgi:ABC-2 type transport system ATP-binding protein